MAHPGELFWAGLEGGDQLFPVGGELLMSGRVGVKRGAISLIIPCYSLFGFLGKITEAL